MVLLGSCLNPVCAHLGTSPGKAPLDALFFPSIKSTQIPTFMECKFARLLSIGAVYIRSSSSKWELRSQPAIIGDLTRIFGTRNGGQIQPEMSTLIETHLGWEIFWESQFGRIVPIWHLDWACLWQGRFASDWRGLFAEGYLKISFYLWVISVNSVYEKFLIACGFPKLFSL